MFYVLRIPVLSIKQACWARGSDVTEAHKIYHLQRKYSQHISYTLFQKTNFSKFFGPFPGAPAPFSNSSSHATYPQIFSQLSTSILTSFFTVFDLLTIIQPPDIHSQTGVANLWGVTHTWPHLPSSPLRLQETVDIYLRHPYALTSTAATTTPILTERDHILLPHADSPLHNHTPSYCPLPFYVAYCLSQTFAIPVSPLYTILVSSSSLDVTGCARHYNTMCHCPLLQYFPIEYAILRHCL